MNPSTPITLNLTLREVEGVLAGLGELPTASGVFPIMMKVRSQTEAQLPIESQQAEEPKAE